MGASVFWEMNGDHILLLLLTSVLRPGAWWSPYYLLTSLIFQRGSGGDMIDNGFLPRIEAELGYTDLTMSDSLSFEALSFLVGALVFAKKRLGREAAPWLGSCATMSRRPREGQHFERRLDMLSTSGALQYTDTVPLTPPSTKQSSPGVSRLAQHQLFTLPR
jgi:hypothetical protein